MENQPIMPVTQGLPDLKQLQDEAVRLLGTAHIFIELRLFYRAGAWETEWWVNWFNWGRAKGQPLCEHVRGPSIASVLDKLRAVREDTLLVDTMIENEMDRQRLQVLHGERDPSGRLV